VKISKEKLCYIIVFTILLITAYSFSVVVRTDKLELWSKFKNEYIVGQYPAMTTLDAYYWLRYAKEFNENIYIPGDNDTLRFFPDFTKKPTPVPLLSFLIAKLSFLNKGNYYYTGLYLIPFLASLFIIPLGIYFFLLNLPLAGLMGGVLSTVSYMYIARTLVGRVDTDALNLFFPLLASLFLLLLYKSKNKLAPLIYAPLAGLTMLVFYWWYFHPGFHVIYLLLLIVILFLKKVKLKMLLSSIILFIVFSNPLYFLDGLNNLYHFILRYLFVNSNVAHISLPNIMATITEAQERPLNVTITAILSNAYINYIGILCFFIAAIFYYKDLIPLLPLLVLGLLSFKSSIRFVMFLSPFVGIGYGAIIHIILKRIDRLRNMKHYYVDTSSLILVLILSIIFIKTSSFYKYNPTPSISANIISSFIDLKNMQLDNPKIISWWDYGYAIEDITGYATYHDGGSQTTVKTYLIAKALASSKQEELYNIISYINNNGIKEINDTPHNKYNELMSKILNYNIKPKDNNLILFSSDMITKFRAISEIGTFDVQTGRTQPGGFQPLHCTSIDKKEIRCGQFNLNFETGLINEQLPIKKVVYIDNGYVDETFDFYKNGIYVELLTQGSTLIGVFLLEENTFNSNFNQIYLLGNFNKKYFDEVYNKYPTLRVLKIKYK
jgi:dolichyl-diphosphooligosaccharide--protein glycosyltransferase